METLCVGENEFAAFEKNFINRIYHKEVFKVMDFLCIFMVGK